MTDSPLRFRRHPAARLFGADGAEAAGFGGALRAVIPEHPAAEALSAAFAAADAGVAFRIGGPPDAPSPGVIPVFETLTGGSTGSPRRIRRSHASWIESFRVNAGLFGIGPGQGVAVLGALSHSLPLYAAVEALHLGADLHLLGGLGPRRQASALAARGVRILYATPAQLGLLADGAVAPVPGLACLIVGGGTLEGSLRARLAPLFPNARVQGFYGTAEASFIALSGPDAPPGAAGSPYPGVTVDLRDAEGGAAGAGPGLVWVSSPYLAEGYAGDDPGAAVWRDGRVCTGEWGRMEGGQLFILGRDSRRIRVAEQSVFPEEIEAFLLAQPGLRQAAVLPRPDPRRGQRIEAVLQGDPGCGDAVLRALRARFGPLAAPRRLHWRGDWPLLPSGKTDLAALAAALP